LLERSVTGIERLPGHRATLGCGLTTVGKEGDRVRAKKRGHPVDKARATPPPGLDLDAASARATYDPSGEHKHHFVPR